MNIATRKTGRIPIPACPSIPAVWVRTDRGWWLKKISRISANTSIPRISAPTPMLLMIDSRRTPNALMQRRRDQRHERPEDQVVQRRNRRWISQLEPKDRRQDERHRDRDGRRRQDAGPEVDPAREPAERLVRQALRPLVDRSGHREVARELGEVQRDERLAEDDERPRPEERRAADAEPERDERERPGRDADVAERDREVRQEAERPLQLRLDPQRPQVGIVSRRLVRLVVWTRHDLPPPFRPRRQGRGPPR